MLEDLMKEKIIRAPSIGARHTVAVVDDRQLVGDCLVACLRKTMPHDQFEYFLNVIDCIAVMQEENEPTLVLMSIGARTPDDSRLSAALATLREAFPKTPVIVLADGERAREILKVLDLGARGYIPTSVSLQVATEAINLVGVGGTFIPASSLTSSRNSIKLGMCVPVLSGAFTIRQTAVVEALRKGKANKIIAYELNMRESTVKVHVRNIMKTLKANNRTEVAFMLSSQMVT